MLGQTTPGVMRLRERLIEAGYSPVVFHANGVGGPAMERLAIAGSIGGVVDYTLSELANSLMDGLHATGDDRLRVAGRLGLPQVVVPGCCDFFNQGAHDTVRALSAAQDLLPQPGGNARPPDRGGERRAGPDDRPAPGRRSRPHGRRRPDARLLAGRRGSWPLHDPAADRALIDALRAALGPDVAFEEVDAHVDDADFADLVADRYLSLIATERHGLGA